MQINITTERLGLRPADFSDIDLIWSATRFPGFNDGMTWNPPVSKGEIVSITERNKRAWKAGTDYVFTIDLMPDATPIGRVGLHQDGSPGSWRIGFWVHPDYWGRG